ncbi:MAG TPA: hypothetical protein VFX59_10860 [Polyangiales bacterium]|nr:hypothetical protein [Polyangiales bacterium]
MLSSLLFAARGQAQDPDKRDASVPKPDKPKIEVKRTASARPSYSEVLHSTSALSRLRMRCRASGEDDAEHKPLDRLTCAFATFTLRQQPPEKMATLANYGEILRDLRGQCRENAPRTEPGRIACAACRPDYTDECLYVEAMKDMRKGCDELPAPRWHANPAVAQLEQSDAARGLGSALMGRFCAACPDDPSAACLSAFWQAASVPNRCTLASDGFEIELTRQGKTSTWTANLGEPCNTQITLALDEKHRTWTYSEIRLTPERCAQGSAQSQKPAVYSSAPQYAFPDLAARCDRITLL